MLGRNGVEIHTTERNVENDRKNPILLTATALMRHLGARR